MYTYQTIREEIENILLNEKGSKFIGFVYPILNEEDAKYKLQKIKEIHPKATHHCYAYRLGTDGENYRANDDGEPSGSAGLPIYNQLLAHQITNVLLVVVRYFGGTKLGVSGLVKAYKESAKETLEHTKIITKELENSWLIKFHYSQQNHIFTILHKCNAQIVGFLSNEICELKAQIKTIEKKNISEKLSEMQDVEFIIN